MLATPPPTLPPERRGIDDKVDILALLAGGTRFFTGDSFLSSFILSICVANSSDPFSINANSFFGSCVFLIFLTPVNSIYSGSLIKFFYFIS